LTLQQAMLFVGCLVACLFVCYGWHQTKLHNFTLHKT
jgi:type III secretory pathway component EscS